MTDYALINAFTFALINSPIQTTLLGALFVGWACVTTYLATRILVMREEYRHEKDV